MNNVGLIEKIKEIFINEDSYQMKKHIEEFFDGEKFVGDYYNYTIYEDNNSNPFFYHIFGPFDIYSKKAPQQALVWNAGKLVLNIDYTEYADMRTGAMDALLLKELDIDIKTKNILLFGTGKTAKWSLKILKDVFPELSDISVSNRRGNADEFIKFAKELGVGVRNVKKEELEISQFDIILCHTNADKPLLTKEDISKIKKGAIITHFISSTEYGELADEFFDTSRANIIVDWNKYLEAAKNLKRSIDSGLCKVNEVVFLKELFKKEVQLKDKDYTVFLSKGTPMQNLAVLKLLQENKS